MNPVFKWKYNMTIDLKSSLKLTSEEVVDYVIWMHESGSIKRIDPHLRPQHLLCDFCTGDIDVLGKVESRDRDFEMVTQMLGLQKVWKVETRENKSSANGKSCQFYSKMNQTQIYKLQQVYKVDFEMFGYDFGLKC